MGNAERTEPLTIIGPKGVERVVNSLRVIAPELPFEIQFIELTERQQEIEIGPYTLTAFRVQHNIVCYSYSIELKRAGKFQVEKAKEADIPLRFWNRLQKGETIQEDGMTYTPDMVMGPARKGLKVTYSTDTRPVPVIAEMAAGADLFICEGMYGEPDKLDKAKEHKHMTFYEAAELARQADCKEMWLTHYSPSLQRPEQYIDAVRQIFPRSYTAKDGRSVELHFEEEQ
jgi:ribonuclease Z